MDSIKEFKEKIVNNYIYSIDYNNDDISVKRIQDDLKTLLQERPSVWLDYKQETLVNEDGTKSKKLEKLESITITFTYDVLSDNQSKTIPVKKTYIVS